MDKELLKLLKKVRDDKDIEPIIFSIYPNYKTDFSFKKAVSLLKNDNFKLLEFREKIIGHNSIYTEVVMKTAHELTLKQFKVTPSMFNRYFRANWIGAILNDNIGQLFADPFLPIITFSTLNTYIQDLKTGKIKSNKKTNLIKI